MKSFVFISLATLLLPSLRSQEGGTIPSPRELRFLFGRDIAAASLEQESIYIQQIYRLEREAATKGDYATAIVYRDERRAAEARLANLRTLAEATKAPEPETSPVAETAPPTIISLRTSAARLEGGASLSDTGLLENWITGAKATWDLPGLAPGGYEVVLEYSSQDETDTSLQCKEQFYTLGGRLEKTDPDSFTRVTLGTIRISNGAGQFTLTDEAAPESTTLRLRSIELIPADS
jgi:hypothetical protein